MSLEFLLDTNILSEPLRPKPKAQILANLKKRAERLATASVVWHELKYGQSRLPDSKRKAAIAAYIDDLAGSSLAILPYDEKAAAWHGEERARLEAAGKTPPFVDGQIAAIAFTNGLTLVTRDTKGFKAFRGLKVVSW